MNREREREKDVRFFFVLFFLWKSQTNNKERTYAHSHIIKKETRGKCQSIYKMNKSNVQRKLICF